MSVRVGSARIDEHGNIHGGAAGDQTGKEVCTQDWYLHSKGWVVLRPASAYAEKIAATMEAICANDHIGYDQYQRNTLYSAAQSAGWNIAKITTNCETDCSAAVRVCLAAAGIMVSDFNTSSEAGTLLGTGKFTKFTESQYTTKSDNLKRGDVLVTKTKGHTVVVLDNGANVKNNVSTNVNQNSSSTTGGFDMAVLSTVKNGSKGAQVKSVQILLNGKIGAGLSADGIAGSKTVAAIKAFQKANGLSADGICGKNTWSKLLGVS